jgi:hypothetical protein
MGQIVANHQTAEILRSDFWGLENQKIQNATFGTVPFLLLKGYARSEFESIVCFAMTRLDNRNWALASTRATRGMCDKSQRER